jgi:ubiquinone/menaquinone biosynthesis C-methylase UbiE
MAHADNHTLIGLYRSRAKHYDFSARLFPLVGFRQGAYRKQAIQALCLQPGDVVVDVGCGTGLNFPLLRQAVGPTGRVVGVDLTDAMLDRARERVVAQRWDNVELVQSDAAEFSFPPGVGGIISAFALTLVPEYDEVIRRGSEKLLPGKRWVVLDFKLPNNWLAWLAPLLERLLTRPFGGTLDMVGRHPWESMQKYLRNVTVTELYLGFAYIAWGAKESTDKHE